MIESVLLQYLPDGGGRECHDYGRGGTMLQLQRLSLTYSLGLLLVCLGLGVFGGYRRLDFVNWLSSIFFFVW